MIGRQLGKVKFVILNKMVRLKLSETIKFEYLKVTRDLDMQVSGRRSFCAKTLRQEYSSKNG